MLRYFIFGFLGPLVGLIITASVTLHVAYDGKLLLAFVLIGFLPALVPALVTAFADTALDRRRGPSRYAYVALIGAAATLAMCSLSRLPIPYFAGVATVAGGISAALCCWLHVSLEGYFSARAILVTGFTILASPFALVSVARYGGLCLSSFKHVSNAELVAAGVAYRASDNIRLPEKWTAEDIERFIREHPGCCRITSTDLFSGKWVQVLYVRRPHGENYSAEIKLDSCGRKVDFMGEPITPEEMKRYMQMGRRVWPYEILSFLFFDSRVQRGPTVTEFWGGTQEHEEESMIATRIERRVKIGKAA